MRYLDKIEKIYGPYRRKDGREVVILSLSCGKKRTMSYPKFLKECELNRELDPSEETIDHINRDVVDNSKDNIQILSRKDNSSKSALRAMPVSARCVWCQKPFELSTSQRRNSSRDKAGPFCSRLCSGRYGKSISTGSNKLPKMKIKVSYYRMDDK